MGRLLTTMYWVIGLAVFLKTSYALYPSNSDVIDLTERNFDELVTKSDNVWIVEFYAPWCGHCQQLVPEYSKAAKALKGIVKVGGVDADQHKSLAARFSVQGFPTIKIFDKKTSPTDYQGARQARAIVDSALDTVKNKAFAQLTGKSSGGDSRKTKGDPADVVELTDSNFDKLVLDSEDIWLVEFYAPWCGHCKNLAPHWADAATQLKGKVKLGALDATAHQRKASEYNVRGYPSIKYFAGGKKDSSSAEDYNGGRTASDIVNFALEKHSENVPPPEIVQATSPAVVKGACEEHPLCIVAVLPHILDCQAECRNKYIKMLTNLGEKFKKKLWGWVWSEAGAQPDLEAALDIGGFGYPALAVLNAKKMKYSILRGSFSESGISEFLRDLSFGRGTTGPVKGAKLPDINKIDPWDGKDGELPPEEEIDLSDVELEDLKEEL